MSRPTQSPARPEISLTQVASSALAAASAAFAASYLGVAGTIIGAAVGSVVATVAGATYASSLHRSRDAVRRTAQRVRPLPAEQPVPEEEEKEAGAPGTDGALSWRRTALTAAAVLAITLGAVTTVEGVLGKPLAGLVGQSDATGTSIGATVDPTSSGEQQEQAPTRETTPTTPTTPTTSPTEDPTATPTGTPAAEPTDEPTGTPTTTPTTAPTADPTPTDDPTATGYPTP